MKPIIDINGIVTLKFNEDIVPFNELRKEFIPKSKPMLWCRCGVFKLVPVSIIREALHACDICMSDGTLVYEIFITWDQGVDVDPVIGNMLLGE